MEFSTRHIDYLSRAYLDEAGAIRKALISQDVLVPDQSSLSLMQVTGVSRFWEPSPRKDKESLQHRYRMEDVLIGCHGADIPLVFSVRGSASFPDIEINLGSLEPHAGASRKYDPESATDFLVHSLPGHYPGIQTRGCQNTDVVTIIEKIATARFFGMVTGIPAVKVTDEIDDPTQLDRLIRTMYGSDWGLLIVAQPFPDDLTNAITHSVLNEMRVISNAEQTKQTWAPVAKSYSDTLERLKKQYEEGRATGLWATTAYYFSVQERHFLKLAAAIRAYYGGEDAGSEPVRAFEFPGLSEIVPKFGQPTVKPEPGPGNFQYPFKFQTLLNSGQLAVFMHLPRLEVPGFTIRQSCHFDVVPPQSKKQSLQVGEILHYGGPIGSKYTLSVDSLQKHCLVVGVTGSGKTNTSFHLLVQLWKLGIPFLVLEPAKTEYRALLTHERIGPDLRIFTLGDERVSPLRMNPFEVEAGVSVSTHIDLLKSVFNASFGMWNPLPQVLERCIHLIYQDRGWDPTRNINLRLESETSEEVAASGEMYPTLTDLYEKIDEVVENLGYEERVKSDIKAALMTRINSLRIGSKGIMLDTHHSMPIAELLSKPTIVELEQIGDDDEKAFLMGLLMTRIYEYLRGRGSTEGASLKHVVVIEEAHRLLANVPPRMDQEQSNVRGKAVETFTSMLSEVRAYGEGFIVAEQIAVKLALDVIKNTNLKIVHRTVAGEDRRMLGETMNMDSRQCDMLAVLRVGEAAVFVEGDDKPIMVSVPYAKIEVPEDMKTKAGSDKRVAEHMKPFRSQPHVASLFVPFEACFTVCQGALRYCDNAKTEVSAIDFQERFAAFVLSTVVTGVVDDNAYLGLLELVRSRLPRRSLNISVFSCIVLNALRWYFDYFGRRYGWSYDTVGYLRGLLSSILLSTLPENTPATDEPELAARITTWMAEFQELYRLACRRLEDPFTRCSELCPSGECLFRYHNEMLFADSELNRLFDQELEAAARAGEWREMNATTQATTRLNGYELPEEAQRSVGLCYGMMQISYNRHMLQVAKEQAIGELFEGWELREFYGKAEEEAEATPVTEGELTEEAGTQVTNEKNENKE